MLRAFSLAFVTAFFKAGFCSGKRVSDHVKVVRLFSMVRMPNSLNSIPGRSTSNAGRSVSVLTSFFNKCTYVVQENCSQ